MVTADKTRPLQPPSSEPLKNWQQETVVTVTSKTTDHKRAEWRQYKDKCTYDDFNNQAIEESDFEDR